MIQFNASGELDCMVLRKMLDRELCAECYSPLEETTVYQQPICSLCDVCFESISRSEWKQSEI